MVMSRCWASQPVAGALPPWVLERRMYSTLEKIPEPVEAAGLRRSQGTAEAAGEAFAMT